MEIKNKYIVPIGINRDMGNSVFPDNKLFDALNVNFIAQSDNSTLVITNEKGNLKVNTSLELEGNIVGSINTEDSIIVFTTTKTLDIIYKLSVGTDIYNFKAVKLFEGILHLDTNFPIKAIYNYENTNIRKVYFTDGINPPRYINIVNDTTITDAEKLAFVPEFNINASIALTKNKAGGQFTAGTIQYAISYFYKYGAETNIFSISSVANISNFDKAGAPNEIVSCSFTLNISNIDTRFDYIRLYTIERTSVNSEPICRKIDLNLKESVININGIPSISFIDNGKVGETFSAAELLYVGGESLLFGTIEARDNVLFGGNITINRPSLKDIKVENPIKVSWYRGEPLLLENPNKGETLYGYKPLSLNEIETSRRYFKNGEIYRIGFQAQYPSGKWSEVMYLGQDAICNLPMQMNSNIDNRLITFNPTLGKFTLSYAIVDKLKNLGYVAVRPVFVQPTLNDRRVVAQGLLTNTISYGSEMLNVEAYSDYLLRTEVYWNSEITSFPQSTAEDRNKPTLFSSTHFTPIFSTAYPHGSISEKQPNLYEQNKTPYEFYTAATTHIFSTTLRYRELDIYAETLVPVTQVDEINNTRNVLFSDTIDGTKNGFFVNQNIIDFWSPSIEFSSEAKTLATDNTFLKIVGVVPFASSSLSNDVILSTTVDGIVFSPSNIKEEAIKEFEDYTDSNFDYTLSQGRTKVVNIVEICVDGNVNSSIEDLSCIALPIWSRKNIMIRKSSEVNTYIGTTTITRKSTGRFHYSPFNRYFNQAYIRNINIFSPVYTSYDENPAMLTSLNTSDNSGTLVGSGMNKLFPNLEDVAKLTTIKYKTAPHFMFALKEVTHNNKKYRNVLPTLTRPSVTIWNTTYESLLSNQNDYYREAIVDNVNLATTSPVFTNGEVMLNGETFCYLGEIVRDLGNSQYGGQVVVYVQAPSQEDGWFIDSEISEAHATASALQNNIWIPCGDRVILPDSPVAVELLCTIGDTYLQRYDLVKTSPITEVSADGSISVSSEDYQLNTTVVSFLVETTINLDGRYDKRRYNNFVHGVNSNSYNLINLVYSQYPNVFNFRGLDYEEFSIDTFKTSFTWSTTKIAGEYVDSWVGFDLKNIYDCNGSLGKITSFRQLGMYLIGFQENGIFNLLHNVRTSITPSDGVPLEIATAKGVSGIRYITTTTGAASDLVTAVSPKGLYFIDTANRYIGIYNDNGVQNLSESKGLKSWSYNNISQGLKTTFFNSNGFSIFVDLVNSRVYFTNKDTCLVYSEMYDVFLGFYSYKGMAGLFNMLGDVFTLSSDTKLYLQHRGLYNHYFGNYANSHIVYKFNPDPLIDKTFNWFDAGFDAYSIADESSRLTESGVLRNLEVNAALRSNIRVTEDDNNRITQTEDYRLIEEEIPEDNNYRILEGSGNFYVPNRFFNLLKVENEYQRNEVPLEVGLFTNAVRKFRRWKVIVPRDKYTINRFRNTWLDAKFTFIPEVDKNIKFNLYNMGIYYTIH